MADIRLPKHENIDFQSKKTFSNKDLLECSRGLLFGENNAQLPAPPMLMFDSISNIEKEGGAFNKGQIDAELAIKKDLWFFDCHFINDPVMPGCFGLDALWQLTGFFLGWLGCSGRGRAFGVGEVKFTGQITPEVKLVSYHIDIKRVIKRQVSLAFSDGEVFADGESVYTVKNMKVGTFVPED